MVLSGQLVCVNVDQTFWRWEGDGTKQCLPFFFFWVQQLCAVKVKIDSLALAGADNWLFLCARACDCVCVFLNVKQWAVSVRYLPAAALLSSATMWNVNERMQAEETFEGERDFLFEHAAHSVNRTVTLRNWEFWLIESPPFLFCWSSHPTPSGEEGWGGGRLQTRRWSPVNFFFQRISSF